MKIGPRSDVGVLGDLVPRGGGVVLLRGREARSRNQKAKMAKTETWEGHAN